jgi:outer membrane protein
MNMKTIFISSMAGVAFLMVSSVSLADAMPGNEVRVGAYYIQYSVKADDLSGPLTPPGLNATLENTTTAYFAYVRRLDPHFHLEVAFGLPPKTKTRAVGPATLGSVPFDGQEILTAKWISPTITLLYVFFDESAAFRPYIGIGVNHTSFVERRITAAGEAIVGGPSTVSLSSSTGVAGTIGLSWHVKDAWSVYGSYSMAQIQSDVNVNTLGVNRGTHINFGPRTFILSVGYSF